MLWLSLHKYNQLRRCGRSSARATSSSPLRTTPFINSLIVTLKYALVAVPLNLIIALPIAMGLNQVTRLRAVFRSAFFLPTVASAVAVSLIWRYVYEPQTGILNAALATLGLPQPSWLADPATALWAILITAVWQDLGYNILILLAGLQTIPDDFYDAAKVDGAGAWPRFKDVTIPLLSRTLLFVSVLTMISYLQQFTYVQVMPRTRRPDQFDLDPGLLHLHQSLFQHAARLRLGRFSGLDGDHSDHHPDPVPIAALALGVLTMDEALPDRAPSAPGKGIGEGVLIAIFAVVTIIFIMPLVMMVFSAFKPTAEILRVPPTFFRGADAQQLPHRPDRSALWSLVPQQSRRGPAVTALAVLPARSGATSLPSSSFP